jgi:hypothetical protein
MGRIFQHCSAGFLHLPGICVKKKNCGYIIFLELIKPGDMAKAPK